MLPHLEELKQHVVEMGGHVDYIYGLLPVVTYGKGEKIYEIHT